jgi:hypothetical protein
VQPGDDDKAHIQAWKALFKGMRRQVKVALRRGGAFILQHGADHDNALAQKSDRT